MRPKYAKELIQDRNNWLEIYNWFVLRLSKNQIKTYISECVNIVKALTLFIKRGDTSKLYEAEKLKNQIQEPRWTKEKSRMLALENYRRNN